jgi:hypothetical protein
MPGAFNEVAVAELGDDRLEVAAVDAERVGELGLARLPEHLKLLEIVTSIARPTARITPPANATLGSRSPSRTLLR